VHKVKVLKEVIIRYDIWSPLQERTIEATSDSSLVLVNYNHVSYDVDKADVVVWNQCSGDTIEQVCDWLLPKLADRRINTIWLLLGK
jgi:hypothetical protein